MPLGVIGEYGKILWTYSPYLNAQILPAYSPNMFKYIQRIRKRPCIDKTTQKSP
jgi:hypothetical protein